MLQIHLPFPSKVAKQKKLVTRERQMEEEVCVCVNFHFPLRKKTYIYAVVNAKKAGKVCVIEEQIG